MSTTEASRSEAATPDAAPREAQARDHGFASSARGRRRGCRFGALGQRADPRAFSRESRVRRARHALAKRCGRTPTLRPRRFRGPFQGSRAPAMRRQRHATPRRVARVWAPGTAWPRAMPPDASSRSLGFVAPSVTCETPRVGGAHFCFHAIVRAKFASTMTRACAVRAHSGVTGDPALGAVARTKQDLRMPMFLKRGQEAGSGGDRSSAMSMVGAARPRGGSLPDAISSGSYQDAAATTLLMTHRCLPILRSRVNPSFS